MVKQLPIVIRGLQGVGSLAYGYAGACGILWWPMSIMMWDAPPEHRHPALGLLWVGSLAFGPVALWSSYELGVAARMGYWVNPVDAFLPVGLAATLGATAVIGEQAKKVFPPQSRRQN